jgi:hypothetical protein
MSMV